MFWRFRLKTLLFARLVMNARATALSMFMVLVVVTLPCRMATISTIWSMGICTTSTTDTATTME
jgi:hypothetical protein